MITLLALRSLVYRPWRSLLLFLGYGMGVAVMIVLLSIGEALLDQARDERLVGGGDVTVLPEGLDIEVMKTGGIGGLFFSIDHSRFLYRQILASPRLAASVRAVSPQIDGRLLYLRTRTGTIAVRATGEIPSATRAVGAAPAIAAGAWVDDDGDRRFVAPTPVELYDELDHFHLPSATVANRETWGEWHYFNLLAPGARSWIFISYIVGGDVLGTRWGGRLAITVHDTNGAIRRYATSVPAPFVRFSTTDANVRIGDASVTVLPNGRYAVKGTAQPVGAAGGPITLDLVVAPAPRAYFPGAALGGREFVSGYVVAGLRASASGQVCEGARCTTYADVQSYHDHNWGVWRGVTWDWGASRAGEFTILYGRVNPPDSGETTTPFFVYLVDSLGFRAVFRPRVIAYSDASTITVGGTRVHVPSTADFGDVRGDDTLRVHLVIESAMGTDTRGGLIERGDRSRAVQRPYFIQMKGTATISGRVSGAPIAGSGTGFFETYR